MNRSTDYITIMHPKNEIGASPTRFSMHINGNNPELLKDGSVSFLFVLQGELICLFNSSNKIILKAPQMVVIVKSQIDKLECVGNTVLLECVESDKMSPLMQSTSKAFSMPCSEIITLNNKILEWCREMFVNLSEDPNRDNRFHHTKCSKLTSILLEYPKPILGTLYVPLYACYLKCEECTKVFVRDN